MKIQLCVMCYGMEKRFNWMLSSIKDCLLSSKNKVCVDVTTFCDKYKKLMFNTKQLESLFGDFVTVHELDINKYKTRGSHRTWQMENLSDDVDWVLFADADHIYDVGFFDNLLDKAVEIEKFSDHERNMYTTSRVSTDDLLEVNRLIDCFHYPCYIPDTIKHYSKLNTRITSAPGAGNTQLVYVKNLPSCGYVKTNENRDRNFFRSITYRSDKIFRKKFDKVVRLDLDKKQYHLQHERYTFNNLVQQ